MNKLVIDELPATCNPHPDAPHGFNRNASHCEDRYVCDCEYWDEPVAEPYVPMTSSEAYSLSDGLTFEDDAEHMKGIQFMHEDDFIKYAQKVEAAVLARLGIEVGK